MKTKLMIIALTFCSSLAVASDGTRGPPPAMKKKLMKPAPSPQKEQQVDEAVLGQGLGTLGTSSASTAPARKSVRAPAPTK